MALMGEYWHDVLVTVDIYESLRRIIAEDPMPDLAIDLTEPLTDREAATLRYMRGTQSLEEIARVLGVSVNTTKTHARNIYRKLGVCSRRDAVKRSYSLPLS